MIYVAQDRNVSSVPFRIAILEERLQRLRIIAKLRHSQEVTKPSDENAVLLLQQDQKYLQKGRE